MIVLLTGGAGQLGQELQRQLPQGVQLVATSRAGGAGLLPLDLAMASGDSLIARREYANHPRLQLLLQHLRQRAAELAERHSEVSVA